MSVFLMQSPFAGDVMPSRKEEEEEFKWMSSDAAIIES